MDSFSTKSQMDMVFTDFEKAFANVDGIDHSLLIQKFKKWIL
jgi:hypothetical protein